MVARINTGKNISKALNYNEQKVKQGKAEILSANNFIKEAAEMNFYEKRERFEKLIALNERTGTNTLHVSLNFDPSEKLSPEKLVNIADDYMKRIGFGEQPYLVYRHHDSGHPHIHIVSTNIDRHGNRISLHNLGRNQSEIARKAIEIEFGLVKASDKKKADSLKIQPVNARRVLYGKSETRQAISNVLTPLLHQYSFSSLPEFNALLKLFNITANRGQEGSRIFRHNGLTYRVLDEQGNKIGIPQKASSFFMKPTLKMLEGKFAAGEQEKQPHRQKLMTAIDWALLSHPGDLSILSKLLGKENISLVIRESKEAVVYGLTYIDHRTKCVFNGSDLGKAYSAKGIMERCHVNKTATVERVLENKISAGHSQNIIEILKTCTVRQKEEPVVSDFHGPASHPPFADNSATHIPVKKRKRKKRRISL